MRRRLHKTDREGFSKILVHQTAERAMCALHNDCTSYPNISFTHVNADLLTHCQPGHLCTYTNIQTAREWQHSESYLYSHTKIDPTLYEI